jgi:hypothetical protein
MNGLLRVGDLDSLFPKPFQDPVPQFMLHKVLVPKFSDLANEGKIEGGLSKSGVQTHHGGRIRQEAFDFVGCPNRLLQ